MSYTITPNMNLIEPTVGTESGPQYAVDINNSLTLIDQHDHSTGRGVQIQPNGINITSALTFNNNPLTNAQYLNMYLQTSSPTVGQSLYVKNGSESPALPDLFYYDGTNQIQITSGGQLAPVTASISGITYAGGTFTFEQTQSSLPTTPANLSSGSVTIRPNTASTTNGVELNPPSSISSQYSLFLPSIPASSSFLTIDTSGNMSGSVPTANGITASNIANNTITTTQISNTANIAPNQLASVTPQTVSQTGQLATTSTTYVNFLSITPTNFVAGRPVFVSVNSTSSGYIGSIGNTGTLDASFVLAKGTGTVLNESRITSSISGNNVSEILVPPSSLCAIDFNYTPGDSYVLKGKASSSGSGSAVAQNPILMVYQL